MLRILTFLMAVFIASSAAATEGRQVYVDAPKDGYLNLRVGPSTHYHVLEKMRHGDNVTFLAQPGQWAKVYHHKSDTIGWAHGRFLSDTKPRERETHDGNRKFRWVDAPYGELNLRKGPSTGYHVLRKLNNGMKVEIIGRSGKWRLLKLKSGLIGWAHNAYLSKERPHDPAPKPKPDPRPYSDLQAAYDACEHHRGRDFRYCIMQRLPRNR